ANPADSTGTSSAHCQPACGYGTPAQCHYGPGRDFALPLATSAPGELRVSAEQAVGAAYPHAAATERVTSGTRLIAPAPAYRRYCRTAPGVAPTTSRPGDLCTAR